MRKIIPVVAAGAAALTIAGSTFAYAVLDKNLELSVDGATSQVSTRAGTVGEVLSSQGIAVGTHDVVAPAVGAKVVDGTRIAVQYGRKVTVTVDGQPRTFWTTATNVTQAIAPLRLDLSGAKLSTSRSAAIGRQGLALSLATMRTLTVVDAGKARTVRTTAPTIGAALAVAGIKPDADDILSASPKARLTDGAKVTLTRVAVKKVTKTKAVDHTTRYTKTSALERGDSKVKAKGKDGVRTLVYTEVSYDGKLKSRKLTSSKITTAAKAKVVLRGTRKPPPEVEATNDDESSNSSSNKQSSSKSSSSKSSSSKSSSSKSSSNSDSQSSSTSSSRGTRGRAFVTGYTYWDNSPPGSAEISHPVLHRRAGGRGTYRDPITVAVGFGPRFSYGTRFYLPERRKYFIVEDLCGACGRSRGGDYTLDIWLDGSGTSRRGANSCAERVTGVQPVIRNPGSGLPVRSGSVC